MRALLVMLLIAGCVPTSRSDFEVLEPRVVTGVVRSEAGEPIGDAEVSALVTAGTDGLMAPVASGWSDASGRYAVRVPRFYRNVRLSVTRSSWSRASYEWDASELSVDFVLRPRSAPKFTLGGRVTNERGVPLDDVFLREEGGVRTWTNQLGRFELKDVPAGPVQLVASKDDLVSQRVVVNAPSGEVQLVLRDGERVEVRVRGTESCLGLLGTSEQVAHRLDDDSNNFELRGIDRQVPLELDFRCFIDAHTFSWHRAVQPPVPAALVFDFPVLRPMRFEFSEAPGRPLRTPRVFMVRVLRTVGGLELHGFQNLDDAGVMTVLVPEGKQRFELVFLDGSERIASGWLPDGDVVRLTLDDKVP